MQTKIKILQVGDSWAITGLDQAALAAICNALVMEMTGGDITKTFTVHMIIWSAIGKPQLQQIAIEQYRKHHMPQDELLKQAYTDSCIIIPMLVMEHLHGEGAKAGETTA